MSPTRGAARLSRATRQDLYAVERRLRRRFPLRLPAVVIVGPMSTHDAEDEVAGYCEEVDGRFVIRISEDLLLCPRAAVEALVHEWAHARERGRQRGKMHGRRFGDAYWPIYSDLFDD